MSAERAPSSGRHLNQAVLGTVNGPHDCTPAGVRTSTDPNLHDPAAEPPTLVVGAGPAGLTAALKLIERGRPVVVVDQDRQVGGLARTIEYKGFRFDIGGHRFFTKVEAIAAMWRDMLGDQFLRRPRLSRIYYRGRFFDYPLKPLNAVWNLGLVTSVSVVFSRLWIQLFPIAPERSFADWVSNRFGPVLFRIFFKGYTEKVWGIPCDRIASQWAAQRIKGLSLKTAVLTMLLPSRRNGQIKSLIEEFEYPQLGPGQMWEAFAREITGAGGDIRLNSRVVALHHDGGRITSVDVDSDGTRYRQPVANVISTMPVRQLVQQLTPAPPPSVVEAAAALKYRDFLTVALIIEQRDVFADNWIYIHDDQVRVGRIQNYKNWSPHMVPDARFTCLGLEYFCFDGDGLWSSSDADLVALATRELEAIGLVTAGLVRDGTVVRVAKAYPVYDQGYEVALEAVKAFVAGFENLQLVGRNGMHTYNNQDHSMLTAMLAVGNICGESHDLWSVNADDEYHEEQSVTRAEPRRHLGGSPTPRAVPRLL